MAPPGPGGGAEDADGVAPVGAGAAGAAGLAPPDWTAARISFLLMRPPAPLPSIDARSTLFSLAIFRTRGELRIFWPLPRTAGATGGALAAAGVGAGVRAAGAGGGAAAFGAAAFSGAGGGAGVAAGAEVEAAAAAPAASIVATTVWMGTVCPSVTLISFRTPAEGDGISATTLAGEVSNRGLARHVRSSRV